MYEPAHNEKILIADDSHILNNMLRDVFAAKGYHVIQALDGPDCISKCSNEHPDLAFIDVRMPVVDGIEVLRFIKSQCPDTLAVIMTGAGSEQTALQAMRLGADEYITKPFRPMEVVRLAADLLENRAAKKENIRLRNRIRSWEKYLANLTTIINEALVTTNPEGHVEFVNKAGERMWGYPAEELIGKNVHELIDEQAVKPLNEDIVRRTMNNGRMEGEFLFRKKDDTRFPGYISTTVIRENEEVRGMVMVVADLTKLREVEMRLKKSEKLASLGRVVEGVAHEVRNCLTSLGGFARRLDSIEPDDPRRTDYTRIIVKDVERLERMVREIEEYVVFSKFYVFKYQVEDLETIIRDAHQRAVSLTSPDAAAKIRFSVESSDPVAITADATALTEVFFNLIHNAYEVMPDGGSLTVGIEHTAGGAVVTVTDTGPGIDPDSISEIFNPFFTSKTSGAGMGLSKVLMLTEEHGGSVEARSDKGAGATFKVFLPFERAPRGLLT